MRRKIKSGVNYFIALIFIALGTIGLLLPVVPQAVFFLIALIVLSFEIPAIEAYIGKYVNPENYFGKTYLSLREKIERILG